MSNSTNHMLEKMQPNSPKDVTTGQSERKVEQSELQLVTAPSFAPNSPMDELLAQCMPKDKRDFTPK